MSAALADRSLLVGILAVHNQLVTSESLATAFHSWKSDDSQSLGQVLMSAQRLTRDELALLDTLVDELLKRHGGSTEKCLDAFCAYQSIREELQRLQDTQVQARLKHATPKVDFTADRGDARNKSPHADGLRYQIIRAHAEGGLGVVSVAHDQELNRTIALKEIKPQYADDTISRARFLREAEITGGLEHPGIVPIYSLGRYGDGRPFYAMLFIRGESLETAVKEFHRVTIKNDGEWTLQLRRLLQRFISVCQAMEYAHSRKVLHRDIKPSNIMLGRYGETFVVDWGLARAAGSTADDDPQQTLAPNQEPALRLRSDDAAVTMARGVIGTPAYMPPEQAIGDINRLGPASDVYALGATLYQILTGRPPALAPKNAVVDPAPKYGRIVPPRSINSRISRGLEAICLKALSFEPEDRYSTAQQLASDIEQYLADEPVQALPDTLTSKFARYARRHREWMLAGAAALAMISIVTGIAYLRASRDAETNRETVAASLDLLGSLNKVLGEPFPQYGSAGYEQKAPILRLADDVDRWFQKHGDRKEFQQEVLLPLIWEGNMHAQIGDSKKAADYFEEAARRAKSVVGDKNAALTPVLWEAPVRAAYVLDVRGQHDESERLYKQVIEGTRQAGDELAVARANYYYAESLVNRGDINTATKYAENSLKVIEALREQSDDPSVSDGDLEQACHMLGRVRASEGRFDEALELHKRAGKLFPRAGEWLEKLRLDRDAQLIDRDSVEDVAECNGLINSLSREIHCLIPLGRLNQAVRLVGDQNLLLAQQKPAKNVSAQVKSHAQAAAVFHIWRKADAAEKYLSALESIGSTIDDENGAYYQTVLGRARYDINDFEGAKKNLSSAHDIYSRLATEPTSPYRIDMAICQSNLGHCLYLAGQLTEGETKLRGAINEMRKHSLDVQARDALATMYTHLADLLLHEGRKEAAASEFGEAYKIRQELVEKFPAARLYQYRLAEMLITFPPPLGNSQRAASLITAALEKAEIADRQFFQDLLDDANKPRTE